MEREKGQRQIYQHKKEKRKETVHACEIGRSPSGLNLPLKHVESFDGHRLMLEEQNVKYSSQAGRL